MTGPRKLVFSLIPVLALWILLEAALRVIGVEPAIERDDPFVGFESTLPLFIHDVAETGSPVLRTADNKRRFFNAQSFPLRKAPAARRVFCVGGSTTYGRPYADSTSFCGWLRETLPAVDPGVSWDVVNAGGISYASYRVAALVEELSAYEPDLLLVYTGQNEFLEERTYRGVRRTPGWVRWLDARLRGLRSYALIEAVLGGWRSGARSSEKDELATEVQARLDSSVGLDAYVRDDALAANVIEHFRLNLDRIVSLGRSAGAEVMLVVPADNLKDCAPFKSEPSEGLTDLERTQLLEAVGAGRVALRAGEFQAARSLLQAAVAIDARHAAARYELGRTLLALGDRAGALREFSAARDEDICPLRARSELVTATREAAESRDTFVVDFPRLIERSSGEHAAPRGADWFLDHVHPTIEGHRLLARETLSVLHREGWLTRDPGARDAELAAAEQRVLDGIDRGSHGIALRNLAKVLSWAGKTEEAARSARQALELLGNDAESFFILSIDASERGEHEQTIALLRESLRLDPDWVKPRLNLGVALARVGRFDEARRTYQEVLDLDPDHPSVRFNLGRLLARMGRLEEAADAYRQSLALDPDDDDARVELNRIDRLLAQSPSKAHAAARW